MNGEERISYTFGPFSLDLSENRLLRDGRVVALTPKIFDVLHILVKNSGHLVKKEEMLAELWPDSFVEEASLSRAISVLRKVLNDGGSSGERYIETIPKRGYRFVAPVEPVDISATAVVEPGPATAEPQPAPRKIRWAIAASMGIVLSLAAVLYGLFKGDERRPVSTAIPTHKQITFTGREAHASISPDGRYVAYVSGTSSNKQLIVQDLEGGVPVNIWSAPELGSPRWSPDGSQLLFWTRDDEKGGIVVLPRMGGTPLELKKARFIATWSPDGLTVAIAEYRIGKIALVNTLTRRETSIELRDVRRWIYDLDWSPANGRIVFASNDERGHFMIWTIRPDGTDQQKVLEDDMEILSARWTMDGNAIYYSKRMDGTFTLFKLAMNAGRVDAKATASPVMTGLQSDGTFAISADGRRLVYTRAPYHSNLVLVQRSDSSKKDTKTTELTHGTVVVERPNVSPDGKWIVFNAGHEPVANLYIMPITGGVPRQLTFFNSFNVGGVWSPDGKQIAFGSNEGGTNRVWVINADGGSPRPLSSGQLDNNFELAWAPGRDILYQKAGNRNYYQLDAEGRERSLMPDDSVGFAFSANYSKSGDRIALNRSGIPNPGVWLFEDEGRRQALVNQAGLYDLIGWSENDKFVFGLKGKVAAYRGLATRSGDTAAYADIVNVPLNGRAERTLLSLPFSEVGGVSMTPDGRSFVCAVYTTISDVWVVDNFDPSHQ